MTNYTHLAPNTLYAWLGPGFKYNLHTKTQLELFLSSENLI